MDLDFETVSQAIEQGKSIRKAAKLLKRSYTNLQWWLAKNNCYIEKTTTAKLVCRDGRARR